jgi:thiopeptide-type bacteriocin biosynthesis protein
MEIAHRLFCADSANVISYLSSSSRVIGSRELSVLLCCVFFRAAGQEWFECGDIWHRVGRLRPSPRPMPASGLAELSESIRTLLTYDPRPDGPLFGADGPLSFAMPWAAAFHQADETSERPPTMGCWTEERGTSSPITSSSTGTDSGCPR